MSDLTLAAKSHVRRPAPVALFYCSSLFTVHHSRFMVEQATCVSMSIGVDAGVPTAGR